MTQLRDLLRREPKRGLEFPRWLEGLVSVGIVSTDPQVVRRQRCVNVAAFATAGDTLAHLLFNSAYNFRALMAVNAWNVFITGASLLIPRLHRFGAHVGAVTLILLILCGHTYVVWLLGQNSYLQVYFTLAGATLLFFGVQNWRLFLSVLVLTLAALLIVLNFAPSEGLIIPEDTALRDILSTQALVSTFVVNAALYFYFVAALQRAEDQLQEQHERSEALIDTVMPHSIAERLKSGREARIADRIEKLSVLFADVVDFTRAAHDLTPDEVVDYLDRLVRTLDALAEAHGVEKIKTIGDSYMAAAGFAGEAVAHAVAVGRLALAMVQAIDREPPLAGRKLKMRIGIHCGTATAGVIGVTRFSYDVWGDAVNFASRMESHGVPDHIHVSEAYHDLTKGAFVFEERGPTDLKGLGVARTFFLTGERCCLPGRPRSGLGS